MAPKTLYEKTHTLLLDALFPKKCLGCGVFDTWLCRACHTSFPLLDEQKCPLCYTRETPEGEICLDCTERQTPALDGVFAVSLYKSPLLKKTIHAYKYKFIKELHDPLALLMAQGLRHSSLPTPDMIMPVPLHPRRLRWRGFNQAELLAEALDLRIPLIADNLTRTRYTKSQVKMKTKRKRDENLHGAFSLLRPDEVEEKTILLIDDITTTSSTLLACADELKKAGAHRVTGLVLARE